MSRHRGRELQFQVAPSRKCVPVSRDSIWKQKTVSLFRGTLYSHSLTFTISHSFFMLSTSCRDNKSTPAVPVVSVAPIEPPSPLLRPSRAHLHFCAIEVARSVYCRAFEVARSVYCRALEVTRSVYCRAFAAARSVIAAPSRLRTLIQVAPSRSHTQFIVAPSRSRTQFIVAPSRSRTQFIVVPLRPSAQFIAAPSSYLHCRARRAIILIRPSCESAQIFFVASSARSFYPSP